MVVTPAPGISKQKVRNLKDIPAPILIGLVASDVVKVPQALNSLWSQQVVRIIRLDVKVSHRVRGRVEVRDFWG